MAHTEQEDEAMFELSLMIGTVCSGRDPMIVMGALVTVINDLVTGFSDKQTAIAFAEGALASCRTIRNKLSN